MIWDLERMLPYVWNVRGASIIDPDSQKVEISVWDAEGASDRRRRCLGGFVLTTS
ncbi:hypothetical protein HanIR_Chr10g0469211 [Helianthus annuus]|nr:hypothetical protein HanIR_Chr10g0469211 [Helianthus annuus]